LGITYEQAKKDVGKKVHLATPNVLGELIDILEFLNSTAEAQEAESESNANTSVHHLFLDLLDMLRAPKSASESLATKSNKKQRTIMEGASRLRKKLTIVGSRHLRRFRERAAARK